MTPMRLLENGIPLSLLLDLAMGPESADLLDHERVSRPNGRLVPGAQPRRQRPFREIDPV